MQRYLSIKIYYKLLIYHKLLILHSVQVTNDKENKIIPENVTAE